MQIALDRPSAQILPFIARSASPGAVPTNRLTAPDRIQALQWAWRHASPLGVRLEIHNWQQDDGPDFGDYIGIYRAQEPWLAWGVARDGSSITVWHGASGVDLGTFDSLNEALAAVAAESVRPRPGR